MEIIDSDWSNIFIRFIIWGILLFLFFRLIQYVLSLIFFKKKIKRQIRRILLIAEISGWLLFLSWFTFLFSEAKQLFVFVVLSVLLMLIFWISRYWIKHLIAGVIFRSSTRFAEGDILHFGEITGTIKKFRNYTIELETHYGQTIFVPYSKIVDSENIKSESKAQTSGHTFEFETDKSHGLSETMQQIKTSILALPWISVHKMPVINLIGQTETTYVYEVTVYAIDKSYTGKIEKQIRSKFTSEN